MPADPTPNYSFAAEIANEPREELMARLIRQYEAISVYQAAEKVVHDARREKIAAMALQGILAEDGINGGDPNEPAHRMHAEWMAAVAVQYADALIRELDKPQE